MHNTIYAGSAFTDCYLHCLAVVFVYTAYK